MAEVPPPPGDDDAPHYSAEDARGGEIILRTKRRRIIFLTGLIHRGDPAGADPARCRDNLTFLPLVETLGRSIETFSRRLIAGRTKVA